jgi:hypothetical protein
MSTIKQAAVLTGDVVSSSAIKAKRREKLLKTIEQSTQKAALLLTDFRPEIFQGDSFQGYTTVDPKFALRTSLYIIMHMLSNEFGMRVSIGMGDISFETGHSATSDGTAFRHSGRNMEMLKKKDQLIAVGTDNEALQAEWEVHIATLNFLLKRCTSLQAAAFMEMLARKTQQEAADNLKVKQPAIQQRLQAAGWPVFQTIITRFELQF